MTDIYEIQAKTILSKTTIRPKIAVVLGSGLGSLADGTRNCEIVDFKDILHFPVATAPTHKGRFVFTKVNGTPVVYVQGRTHLYEGYTPKKAINYVRLLKIIGVKYLVLTNAAGGINTDFNAGDFMLINDHISCFVPSPLIGENDENFGVRFPDMSNCYNKDLQNLVKDVAKENEIELKEGVYVQLTGPQFESPAEIRFLRTSGADAVGMSTAIEAIAATHANIKVCGISCITNMACGILPQPLTAEEVSETADRVAPDFKKLILKTIEKIGELNG